MRHKRLASSIPGRALWDNSHSSKMAVWMVGEAIEALPSDLKESRDKASDFLRDEATDSGELPPGLLTSIVNTSGFSAQFA